MLRVHHGAVDQTMVTVRPPVDVMKEIRGVLTGMGVDVSSSARNGSPHGSNHGCHFRFMWKGNINSELFV